MSTVCEICDGKGLLSTGDNPRDLSVGRKETCKNCEGRGQIFTAEELNSESVSNVSVDSAESPKADRSSDTGASSGEPSGIVPNIGDPCRMDDDTLGVLGKTVEGAWICFPKSEVV